MSTIINKIKINGVEFPIAGTTGADGVSPTITVEPIRWGGAYTEIKGYRFTVTDVNGTKTADIYHGDPYLLTEEDKDEIVNEVLEAINMQPQWILRDFSVDWMADIMYFDDESYLHVYDPCTIVDDTTGSTVGDGTFEEPFYVGNLAKDRTYTITFVGGECATLAYEIPEEDSGNTGGLEVRPQSTMGYPDGMLCYWEDLSNVSDTSFFVVSGISNFDGEHMFSYTVPVSLAKQGTVADLMLGDEVRINPDHFAVYGATQFTVNLYIVG